MKHQSTSSCGKGALESHPRDDLLEEVNTSIESNESTGSGLNEDLESAIDTRSAHSFSQKEVDKILASGDIRFLRLLHMAIWRELGVLDEESILPPLPVRHAAPDEVIEADETQLAKFECTEGDGKDMTAGEMVQIGSGNSSDNKVEEWIEETVSHQLDNNDNGSDLEVSLDTVVSTPPTEISSQIDREEVSLAKRWADLVVVLYRHPEWRKKVEDIEMRDGDDDDTWDEMQDLLDAYEAGLLRGI